MTVFPATDPHDPRDPADHTATVVFFCHGSRDVEWRAPFDRIVAEFRAQAPHRRCELAFLELMDPPLPRVIDQLAAQGVGTIEIVPLFLAPGAHTRQDLPMLMREARERWPRLHIHATATLTESAAIRAAIVAQALGVETRPVPVPPPNE